MADLGLHERVYRELRDDFLAGTLSAGTKINLRRYARRSDASMTPVREAAFRMVGEQLLEQHPKNGFQIFLPTASELHSLYAWNGQHLLAALHGANPLVIRGVLEPFRHRAMAPIDAQEETSQALVIRTGELFRAIGLATGNEEYVRLIEATNRRLHYLRLAETRLFKDFARELNRLIKGDDHDVENNVRRRILTYHRRRIEQVGPILRLAQSPSRP